MGFTRRRLAQLSEIDPSYVTLIERDGYIPRRDKVLSLAKALETGLDETLLVAGYAPQQMPVNVLLDRIEEDRSDAKLEPELKRCIKDLLDLSTTQQRKVAEVLTSYVKTIKETEKKRALNRSAQRSRSMKG